MRLIIIVAFFSVFSIVKSQDTTNSVLTNEQKVYGLSFIWQEMNYNFPYLVNSKIDWDSAYLANIPKVEASNSLFEYSK